MKYENIIHDLANRVFYPIYFLSGEEAYYIDAISDYIQDNVLSDDEKEFNQTVLYGKDVDIDYIINCAKRYPLMAAHQVIIVKEAQNINKIEEIEKYLLSPLKSTILVICYKYKTIDKRKKFAKELAKNAVLFESSKIYDNQVAAWIQTFLKDKGYTIAPEAAQIVAESLGTDLSKIVNELSKLFIILPKNSTITAQLIEENIGISKDFNVFELVNAIGNRDVVKANRIINHFASNPKAYPFVLTISSLFNFFRNLLIYHSLGDKSKNNAAAALKVNPYFIRNYETAARIFKQAHVVKCISLIRRYDLKSKGVDNLSTSHDQLLKELIFHIMH